MSDEIRFRGTTVEIDLGHEVAAQVRTTDDSARRMVEGVAAKTAAKFATKIASWAKRHGEAVERGKAARGDIMRLDSERLTAMMRYFGRSLDLKIDELVREHSKVEEAMRAADRDAEDCVEMLGKIRDEAVKGIAAAVGEAVRDRAAAMEAERDASRGALFAAVVEMGGRHHRAVDGLAHLGTVRPDRVAVETIENRHSMIFGPHVMSIAPFPPPPRIEVEEEVERTWHPAPFPASYG